MIICPVCKQANSHLAVVCEQCGSFLQTRIDTLDLFATSWNIIERPFKTFHRIAVAKHKNFVYILSAVTGIAIAFLVLWLIKAGEHSESLVNLLTVAVILGLPLGILTIQVLSIIEKLTMKAFQLDCNLKDIVAVNAYAFIPLVLALVFLVPIKLMTFGTFFFSGNPSPLTLRPTSYILLLTLDALFTLWSIVLLLVGVRVLSQATWLRVIGITFITLTVVIVLAVIIYHQIFSP